LSGIYYFFIKSDDGSTDGQNTNDLMDDPTDYEFSLSYTINLIITTIKNFFVNLGVSSSDVAIISKFNRVYKYIGTPFRERESYFVVGSTVVDLNNDGNESLFVGGGEGQPDALLAYNEETNSLDDIGPTLGIAGIGPTYAAVTFDMTGNGHSDIVVARSSGIFIYENSGSAGSNKFTQKQIYKPFEDAIPAALSISDFNKNGLPDIYVSQFPPSKKLLAFQFNNPAHVRKNILLQNKGNLKFEDVTKQYNVEGYQNTFTSVFVDLGSGWPDLLLANDTGKVELFRNTGTTFKKVNLNVPNGFWMGIAVGDYNNDGNLDFFFTNVGNTLPLSGKGGIRGDPERGGLLPGQPITNNHMMLRNDGDYKFSVVSDEQNVSDYGFGWGCVMEDINLDGRLDLLFAQNYVDFIHPQLLPSAVLFNDGEKFTRQSRYINRNYGQTPVLLDLNGNGIKDIAWVNMKGPIVAYLNNNEDNNNFINVRFPDKIQYINATVTIYHSNKKQIRQNIVGGVGFSGDQSHILSFGIGKDEKVDKIHIKTIYGEEQTIDNPEINKTHIVGKNNITI
jgi:hypothetical protein